MKINCKEFFLVLSLFFLIINATAMSDEQNLACKRCLIGNDYSGAHNVHLRANEISLVSDNKVSNKDINVDMGITDFYMLKPSENDLFHSSELLGAVPPSPDIIRVTSQLPTGIYAQYAKEILITVKNYGGTSNEGYISVSFPNNEEILSVSGDGDDPHSYPIGYPIWTESGQIPAEHPLAELYTNNWGEGEEKTLRIIVKYNTGSSSINFYVRAALLNDVTGAFERDPASSIYIDQQGYYVESHYVYAKPNLLINNIYINNNEISYRIKNNGSITAGPSYTYLYIDDMSNRVTSDYVYSLQPDEERTLSFDYAYTCYGGSDTIRVYADGKGEINEEKEDDNSKTITYGVPNSPPTLENGRVEPSDGYQLTPYTYYVTYKDPDGDFPSDIFVYIDGSYESNGHPMTYVSGSPITGAVYKYDLDTILSEGNHYFQFYCNDGDEGVFLPEYDLYSGPLVRPPNSPPTLENGRVEPSEGYQSTPYTYYVTYKDPDGNAPSAKMVTINDGLGASNSYEMTPLDGSYETGVVYKYETTTPLNTGIYSYYFSFSDGYEFVSLPASGVYNGPFVSELDLIPPLLSVTYPVTGQILTNNIITISGIASDNNNELKEVTVNGIPATGTTNWNAEVELVEGENLITVVATDLSGNEAKETVQVFYHVSEDCYLLFSPTDQIEVGGTYYRWYKLSNPSYTVSIDSEYFEHSQPDEEGIFYVSVNTSKLGLKEPCTLNVDTKSVVISKDGISTSLEDSIFDFSVDVLPRKYNTSWFRGDTFGGGGGIDVYFEVGDNTEFTMSTSNLDSILRMQRDINYWLTIGLNLALFELESPLVEAHLVSTDEHGTRYLIYGSQIDVDYKESEDDEKLKGALYILTSFTNHQEPAVNPLMYSTIEAISAKLAESLDVNYYESGAAIESGCDFGILYIDFSPVFVPNPKIRAEIYSFNPFYWGVNTYASYKKRAYPSSSDQEYIIRYAYDELDGKGDISLLGDELINWGLINSIDTTLTLSQDVDGNLYGKMHYKYPEPANTLLGYSTKDVVLDYGKLNDEETELLFIDNIENPSLVYQTFIENDHNFDEGNITITETCGDKLDIDFPVSITVGKINPTVKLSLHPGFKLGRENIYCTDKFVVYNRNTYPIEKYNADEYVQDPAEELSYLFGQLFEPVGNILADVIGDLSEYTIEKGEEIVFSVGKLYFPSNTYFIEYISPSTSETTLYSADAQFSEIDQSPNVTITTFASHKPDESTVSTFNSVGISSSYAASLSGGDFVISNVTDLQPYNLSFTPAAQLILNYSEEDVGLIEESKFSIYVWDNVNLSWFKLTSSVDPIENEVTTNITHFGTYAIGYDTTCPEIYWNASEIYQGNITVDAVITDTGSGINISSIGLYVDGNPQDFTYNIFSGFLKSEISTSPGGHTVKIYSEDTSGNNNSIERSLTVMEPVTVSNLTISCLENDVFELSWTSESGTYPVEYCQIYKNGEFLTNTIQANYTINNDSATYAIYPVDSQNNTGIGASICYQPIHLIPKFTYDWRDTLYPCSGNPVFFNATASYAINGTIGSNIIKYTWFFDDDLNSAKSGVVISYIFEDTGLHKVTLVVEDEWQNKATLTKIVNIVSNDWNPWNDPDSQEGEKITDYELILMINCWLYDEPVPGTGAFIDDMRLLEVINLWLYG